MYWPKITDQYIIEYNKTKDSLLYQRHIHRPLVKLIEYQINNLKAYYATSELDMGGCLPDVYNVLTTYYNTKIMDAESERDLKSITYLIHECECFVLEKLEKFIPGKGTSLQFFTTTVFHWVIQRNNKAYINLKNSVDLVEIEDDRKNRELEAIQFDEFILYYDVLSQSEFVNNNDLFKDHLASFLKRFRNRDILLSISNTGKHFMMAEMKVELDGKFNSSYYGIIKNHCKESYYIWVKNK